MPRHRQFLHGLLFSMLLALPVIAAEPGVQWVQDIESAKAMAQQSGRLVLVHFWTPECVPCRSLDLNVFSQPSVAAALQSQYVPVKLNANENPAIAQGFGITHVPTDVILTPSGQVIGMSVSPATPGAYMAQMSQVARQFASRPVYQLPTTAAQQPMQVNAAYANLQFGAPPAAAAPAAPQARTDGFGPVASGSPYMWASAGTPANTPPTPTQPSYTAPYQPPAPATPATTVANRAYGTQPWPAVSTTPAPVAPTPPVAVQNPYTLPSQPAPPSESAHPYAPPLATPNQTTSAPVEPSTPVAAQPTSTPAAATPVSPILPDVRRLPQGVPPLGFEGYCPVSMRTQWKWVPGDPKWGAIHRGRTYWFAGETEQQQFLANPDYYSPALSGIDPVSALDHGQMVPGSREHAIDYDNQFYLFSSEATLQQFTSNPARYAEEVRQAMNVAPEKMVR